mgnify:CR=1 FL=1
MLSLNTIYLIFHVLENIIIYCCVIFCILSCRYYNELRIGTGGSPYSMGGKGGGPYSVGLEEGEGDIGREQSPASVRILTPEPHRN